MTERPPISQAQVSQAMIDLDDRFTHVGGSRRELLGGLAKLAGGMAAALPYCDAFASGHNLTAMREVAAAIAARR